jgi:dihydrofolate reductase
MDRNRNIGLDGDMPWGKEMKSDLRRFKELTTGKVVVMGRKTYESIGRPLPNRNNVILSRDASLAVDIRGKKMVEMNPLYADTTVVPSIEEFFQLAKLAPEQEFFIIGGAQIYEQFLPYADKIYITKVLAHLEGDTKFPTITGTWKTHYGDVLQADDDKYPSQYITFERA